MCSGLSSNTSPGPRHLAGVRASPQYAPDLPARHNTCRLLPGDAMDNAQTLCTISRSPLAIGSAHSSAFPALLILGMHLSFMNAHLYLILTCASRLIHYQKYTFLLV